MTSMQGEESEASGLDILKTDSRQRVLAGRERREAILAEFDRSGASAMRFAAHLGMKYSTLAYWLAQRRKGAKAAAPESGAIKGELQWVEAVAEGVSRRKPASRSEVLRVELPGGASAELESGAQAQLLAQVLVSLCGARC